MSVFLIRITRKDDEPVLLKPNSQGEHDLVEDIATAVGNKISGMINATVARIVARGVGVLRTETQVAEAIAAELKLLVPVAAEGAREGARATILSLKMEVVPR